jgi:hypothetical protein
MDPVSTELNGPAFDLTKCTGKFNSDGSVSLTLAWTPVLLATSYKLIQGGKSPIVLNSIYNNSFNAQTGCFESSGPTKKTKELTEYTTTDTSYTITYQAYIFQAFNKAYSSFLVYAYFGNRRGPIPYSVALIDILTVNSSATGFNEIHMRTKPNISVKLVEKNLSIKRDTYEYLNHFTKKKYIKVPNFDDLLSGADDNSDVLESAVLYFEAPLMALPSAAPTTPMVFSYQDENVLILEFDVYGITGEYLTFSCLYGNTDPPTTPVEANLYQGSMYQCTITGVGGGVWYFKSVASNPGGSKTSELGQVSLKGRG